MNYDVASLEIPCNLQKPSLLDVEENDSFGETNDHYGQSIWTKPPLQLELSISPLCH